MYKFEYPCRDPQQAAPVCYCRRCAREIYSVFDGARLGVWQLCGDCLAQLRREVRA